jgi:hypothetical protein
LLPARGNAVNRDEPRSDWMLASVSPAVAPARRRLAAGFISLFPAGGKCGEKYSATAG